MPVPPESEVEEILFWNVVQSVDERYPFVELFAWEMERVFPENESGAETTAVAIEEPLPVRMPESEVEPVPPPATVRVPESDGAKVKVPPAFVTESDEVRPFVVADEVANVTAPVCAEPKDCCIDVTPLLIEEVATQVGTPFNHAST